jgi:hypothetical protein
MLVPVELLAFDTVTFTLNVFLVVNLCFAVMPVAVPPSPKSHLTVSQSWIV